MSEEKDKQEEYSFIKEKIKKRPLNKRKLLIKAGSTALAAVLFGVVALVTMFTLQPKLKILFEEDQTSSPVQLPVPADEPETEPADEEPDTEQPVKEDFLNDYEKMFSELYSVAQKTGKSMVTVTGVRNGVDWYNNTYEDPQLAEASGLILMKADAEVLILTELDAVRDAATIQVTFNNGHVAEAALKQADGNTGIAIVSVAADHADYNSVGDIQEAELGSSNTMQRGEVVIAIGSPQGYSDAIGYGIITSKGNIVSTTDASYRVLTTDISGSSNGNGVLINLKGQVVGIIAQQYNSDGNTITCLALSDVLDEINMLCSGREIPQIGLKVTTVTENIAQQHEGLEQGVCVTAVMEDSPAWDQGMYQLDIITEFNGQEISTVEEYRDELLAYKTGEHITLTVKREGQQMEFDIELGSK